MDHHRDDYTTPTDDETNSDEDSGPPPFETRPSGSTTSSETSSLAPDDVSLATTVTTGSDISSASTLRALPRTAEIPSFDEIASIGISAPPELVRALHQMAHDIRTLDISVVDYYQNIRTQEIMLMDAVPPRGHVDGGALASTTDALDYLWSYHKYSRRERESVTRLKVADDTIHIPEGFGYLKVPCTERPGYLFVRGYYTPGIPATILSPDAIARALECDGFCTFSDLRSNTARMELKDCSRCSADIHMDLTLIRGLLYTESLIAPTSHERSSRTLPINPRTDTCRNPTEEVVPVRACCTHCQELETKEINVLSREQTRALWHMRLGHINERMVSNLHHYVDGVPNIPRADALHKCPMCTRAKLHKASRGESEPVVAETCWQSIQVDFGFFVQRSAGRKDKSRRAAERDPAVQEIRDLGLRRSKRIQAARRKESATTSESRPPRAEQTIPTGEPPPVPTDEPTPPIEARPALATPVSENKYQLDKFLAHEGPLAPTHKRYHGEPYNLKVRWGDKSSSWQPMSRLFEDVPRLVVEYAREKNLLNNPAWKMVRDLSLDPNFDRDYPEYGVHPEEDELPRDDEPHDLDFVPLSADDIAAKSTNAQERYKRLVGINGETCYCLITDLKSGCWKVSVRRSKAPPMDFFRQFIARHAPNCNGKTIRFDQGGELGGNKEVVSLWEAAGYEVQETAPASSSEIGQVERPHWTIADGVRTMLFAANLKLNLWPYALIQFVFIANCLPRGNRPQAAITMCTGKRVNLAHLRVFGSRIYVLPTHDRNAKADVHARSGIFLGFKKTMRHAYYLDDASGKVKTARHIAFDEGWNDAPDPPRYVRFLKGEVDATQLHLDDATDNMRISLSPFNNIAEVVTAFNARSPSPLGFQVERCPKYMRAYIASFTRSFGNRDRDAANRKFRGGYVLHVGDFPTFSTEDVLQAIRHYASLPDPPTRLVVHVACDERATLSESRPPSLHLRPVDIRRIAAMPLVAGEGNPALRRAHLRSIANSPILSATPADPDDLRECSAPELVEMRKLANDHMTEAERNLRSFTRKNLQKLPNFQDWVDADRKQLDAHFDAGTIGHPVPRPASRPDHPSQVFRTVWARLVKATGVRKSRTCLDGSKRSAPWLRMLVQTYSSCIELPCLRTFIGICVNRGYYIAFGDVDNAHQQSPPPSIDCFLEIDDEIADWYLHRFGKHLDRLKDVMPLYRALQGHPEAGVLWERLINDILLNKMGFKTTTHERNLYVGQVDDKEVLICRQVDDFAAGSADKQTADTFFQILRQHVECEYNAMGVKTEEGMYERYNGIDIIQTRDYVKVGCESYIDRMLLSHGWENPSKKTPETTVPINPRVVDGLMQLEGPPDKSVEAKALAKEHGFSYRNVLGELIYAYVIARLDIGFAVCFLARFVERPHREHFQALKGVCRYLRTTKSWGIMYRREQPLEGLPAGTFEFLVNDPNLPSFPTMIPDQISAALDAAHATDLKTRRSVTGLIVFFCGAAVAWKSRLQPICATSSTEAEFYAAVTAAKLVKYLRYVVQQLDAMRPGPSPMYIDNQAALAMINESRPTTRARHIEIQHFAVQEWRKAEDIIMEHLPGIMNCSDGLTKALSWVLFSRHARRGMGHYLPSS